MAPHRSFDLTLRARGDVAATGLGIERFPDYRQPESWRHRHDLVEIAYIVAGRCHHRIGDEVHECGPGSFCVIHPGTAHDLITEPEGIDVINVYLDLARCPLPDVGAALQSAALQLLPLNQAVSHRRNRFVHLRTGPGDAIGAILTQMLEEEHRDRPGQHEALAAMWRLALIALARHVREHGLVDDGALGTTDAKMEDLRQRLERELAMTVDLAALARDYSLTRHSLCRAFKRHTGASITAYQQRIRVNAAMARLRESAESVLAIALSCGFNDQPYFNRVFRELVGGTPTAWRRGESGNAAGKPRR